jgi:hypothetical protein
MIPGSSNPLLAFKSSAATAYEISRSLRFNSADSANLSRTIASAGDRKTWTWAGWVKRSQLNASNIIFSSGGGLNNNLRLFFQATNELKIENENATIVTNFRTTTALFRDSTAWTHIVLAVDTTQATALNRIRLYINGNEVTSFSTSNNPALNDNLECNNAGTFYYGRNFSTTTVYLNAYLADVHFIDGLQLTPSSFGEFDSATNEWVPIAYTGSYGTNGHKLTFSDNSAATAAALGADTSGGGNNFTPNNLSVTAGAGNDSLVDSPTSYGTDTGLGGEVRGNYCTLNSLNNPSGSTLSNGNLDCITGTGEGCVMGTIAVSSGKWYWEVVPTAISASRTRIGIVAASQATADGPGGLATSYGYDSNGQKANNSSPIAYGASYIVNDVIGVALDLDAGTLVFYANNVSQGTAYSSLSGTFVAAAGDTGGATSSHTFNFGQRPFAYTAPSGFKALCDTNLPNPVITKPSTLRANVLYTGTGASLTPTSSLEFSPDFVWIKSRSLGTTDHALYDTVRGATFDLATNQTTDETTQAQGLTAFNSNGFTVGTLSKVNTSAATYVAWCWDAGSSTVTNTTGTIQSSVRTNTSAGISILTYTGTGTAANVGHGLGMAPQLVIIKKRASAGGNWITWHTSIGATSYLTLNGSANSPSSGTAYFSGAPSSTLINIGGNSNVNNGASTYVAYCFAPVAGYSAFGFYAGNGSTDGPFVHLGFRPGWLLIKCIAGGIGNQNWQLHDSARPGYSPNGNLRANDNGSESVVNWLDLTSTGFKLRSGDNTVNGNGDYIYAAFAESPFKYTRAR